MIIVFAHLNFNSKSNELNETVSFNRHRFKSKPELFNLSVTCLSNPSQAPGETFIYNIRLSNLLGPVANADVKINDPFARATTSVKTDYNGSAIWTLIIPKNTRPQLYIIEFFYQNAKQFSKIAISTETNAFQLPNYDLKLDISETLDARTLVLGDGGGLIPSSLTIKTVLKEIMDFGDDVAKDFLSNSINEKVLVITGLTCTTPNLACAAGITYTTSALANSGIKVIGYRIIDHVVKDKETGDLIKSMFDLATIRISLAKIKPGEGLKSGFEVLSITEEIMDFAEKQYIYVNNKLRGATFAIQEKGSSDVYLMCIYNKDAPLIPDLIIQNPQVLSTPMASGGIVTVSCKNINQGTGAVGRSYTAVWLSQDQIFDGAPKDINLNLDLKVPALNAGQLSKTLSGQITIPPGTSPGRWYIMFGADALNHLNEGNKETNNQVFVPITVSSNIPTQANTTTITASKDPNCKENNTGDYCFQNNTKLDLRVTVSASRDKIHNTSSSFTCILQAGQRQCFFNVPGGAARYVVSNGGFINVSKQYYAEGSLYVDPCQENTFFINPDTPSYSTNIASQTNEKQIQRSKDLNCKENNTGDYCFQNNTKLDLRVTVSASRDKIHNTSSSFTCILQAGQRQCFFNVPGGAARYVISNGGFINASKQYYAEGSLYVDPCQENTFFINPDTQSYSTNSSSQTNEKQIQRSKDLNCKENNTGDYCFQNTTKLDFRVTVSASRDKIHNTSSSFTCILQAGQRQCFFNVPGGAARYVISNGGFINVSKQYYAEGSLSVEPCQEKIFVIK